LEGHRFLSEPNISNFNKPLGFPSTTGGKFLNIFAGLPVNYDIGSAFFVCAHLQR
jgi:hypothetical protein